MARKYLDCREFPSDIGCTLALSADTEDELLETAVQHSVAMHGDTDTPAFRAMLRLLFRDGTPPREREAAGPPARAESAPGRASPPRP